MAIDNYLKEYRDYFFVQESYLKDLHDNISENDMYVILTDTNNKLIELKNSMYFLDTNIMYVEEEVKALFNNIYKKLDKLEELSEGYQNLNTNELLTSSIHSFNIFDIKSSSNYDTYFEALALERTNNIKNIVTNKVIKNNINAVENYTLDTNNLEQFIKINIINPDKTSLVRVDFFNKDKVLIESINEKELLNVPIETKFFDVITNNTESNQNHYTSVDLLNSVYTSTSSTTTGDVIFKKEGDLLKLVIDSDIPTNTYGSLIVTFKYKDIFDNNFKEEKVYLSVNSNNLVLLPKYDIKNDAYDFEGNSIDLSSSNNSDLFFTSEYSYNNLIKHIGNKTFNIKNINAKEFSVSLTINLYSLIDNTKTPLIKGIFGYVTE